MIRLESGSTLLDLFKDEDINLDIRVQNNRDISKIYAPISKTFTLPASKVNNNFFQHYYNVNVSGGFDASQRTPCNLYSGSEQIISGYLELLDAVIENEKPKQYEVLIASSTPNLAKELEDKKLNELTLGGISSEAWTRSNITSSWADSSGFADIRYGLVGRRQLKDGGGYLAAGTNQSQPLTASDFYPYMRLTTIVKAIIEENGWRYESNFLDNDVKANNTYLLLGRNGGLLQDADVISARTIDVSGSTTATLEPPVYLPNGTTIDEDRFVKLTFPSEQQDPSSDWDTTNSRYTAPANGTYKFRFDATFSNSEEVEVVAFKTSDITGGCDPYTSSGCAIQPFGLQFVPSNGNSNDRVAFLNFGFDAGTTYEFYARTTANQSSTVISNRSLVTVDAPLDPAGSTLDYSTLLPDYTQKNFLAQVAKIYNLVFTPDKFDNKLIKIEPYDDWLAAGSTFDLTDYLDISKPISVRPTNSIQNKSISFTMGEGEAFEDERFVKQFGIPTGSLKVADTGNDFANGSLDIETDFTCSLMNIDSGGLTQWPILTDDNFDAVDFGLRLGYWSGVQNRSYYWLDTTGTTTNYTSGTIGFLPPYSAHDPSESDFMLGFTPTTADGLNLPLNNFFTEYWEQFISNIYDNDSRLMTATFKIEPHILNNISLNDLVFVKNQYWLIQSVKYNLNKEVAVMELLKAENSNPVICNLTPSSYAFRGVVTFTDPDGSTTTTATEKCCNFYGYRYNPSDSKCYVKWDKPRTVTDGNSISTLPLFNYVDDPTQVEPQIPVYNQTTRTYQFYPVTKVLEQQFGSPVLDTTNTVMAGSTTNPTVTFFWRQVNYMKSGRLVMLNADLSFTYDVAGAGTAILDLSSVLPEGYEIYDDGVAPPQTFGYARVLSPTRGNYDCPVGRYSAISFQFLQPSGLTWGANFAVGEGIRIQLAVTYITAT